MFRDVYKSANDDIIPDSQLLDKILATEQKKKKPIYPIFIKYGSVAAAFLILTGTLAIYPKLSKTLNNTNDKAAPGTDTVISLSEKASAPTASPILSDSEDIAETKASTNTENENKREVKPAEDLNQKSYGEQKTKEKTLPTVTASPSPTENAAIKNETDGAVIDSVAVKSENSESSVSADSKTHKADIADSDENVQKMASAEEAEAIPVACSESSIDNSAPKASEEGTAPTSAITSDSPVYSVSRSSGGGSSGASGGGGGASSSSGGSVTKSAVITEANAIKLADAAFLQDFGEEFLNSSKIKTEFNEHYIITRYNENVTYTVTVTTDGLLKKQY